MALSVSCYICNRLFDRRLSIFVTVSQTRADSVKHIYQAVLDTVVLGHNRADFLFAGRTVDAYKKTRDQTLLKPGLLASWFNYNV